jgi:hypothetical protein
LRLSDPESSRRHAHVRPVEGGAVVEDAGSTNGTFVNGNQIHGPTLVGPDDRVLVGVSLIQIRTAEAVQRQPSAVLPVPPGLAAISPDPAAAPPAASSVPRAPTLPTPNLDALLDVRVKGKARAAPLAVFILVVFAVLIYLATR